MKTRLKLQWLFAAVGAAPALALAHSGGLDKYGCHRETKTNSYHCHNSPPPPPPPAPVPPPPPPAPVPAPAPVPVPAPAPVPAPSGPPESAIKPPTPAQSCAAATAERVIDGDTLIVRKAAGLERIRINQIDAPERSQPYGIQATQCLANLVQNQALTVCSDGTDRYGRTVASVTAGGRDVGAAMVSQGCAWAYTKYLEAGSGLPGLQAAAQQAGLGLWSFAGSVAPWQYRAGIGPVPVLNGAPAVSISAATPAPVHERIFDWVEHKFPDHATDGTATDFDGVSTFKRCYAGGLCVRIGNGRVALVGPDGVAADVGTPADFLPLAEAEGF